MQRLLRQAQVRETIQQQVQRDFSLKPRKGHAKTQMYAVAKTHMLKSRPMNVKRFRVIGDFGVAVRGGYRQQYQRPFLKTWP